MSDFYLTVDVLRGQMAEALLDNIEQAVWVLAEFAERAGPAEIRELAEFAAHIEHDTTEVAAFWRGFAETVENGGVQR